MTDSKPIAIIRQTTTVSIAFAEKPSEERRRQLRDAGYRYENGNWFRSEPHSQMATEELVAQVLAA
ncbi:hypothetical protein [Tautonia marina]|jgi:hypothetical protein|uniref:hypothetical protein n=1 Tax=Tautonia marina TaxID=2653855 RepID=UPI001260D0C8|nr:hypothetical protein [Tautonia marina]